MGGSCCRRFAEMRIKVLTSEPHVFLGVENDEIEAHLLLCALAPERGLGLFLGLVDTGRVDGVPGVEQQRTLGTEMCRGRIKSMMGI